MGLFSTKIRTDVSSVVYNLAGDENLRPNFLSSTIVGNVLRGNGNLSQSLISSHMQGSGIQQRRYFNWAKNNYTLGMPSGVITGSQSVDTAIVNSGISSLISINSNETVKVTRAVIDDADVAYWAEAWIVENYPLLGEDEWTAFYNKTDQTVKVVISVEGEQINEQSFAAPADLLWGIDRTIGRKILFVLYSVLSQENLTSDVTESDPVLLTYRMGSGNLVLDALAKTEEEISEFFPAIPLRIDNLSITDSSLESTYTIARKAFKKLTGKNIDILLDSIEDNDKIDDIDFAYMVHGVCLNVLDNACRGYLYKFFQTLLESQQSDESDYLNYAASQIAVSNSVEQWEQWTVAHDRGAVYAPKRNTAQPETQLVSAEPTTNELKVHSVDMPDFDFRIRWDYIKETQHVGNGKTFDGDLTRGKLGHGEYWFHTADDFVTSVRTLNPAGERDITNPYRWVNQERSRIFLFYQHSKLRYSRLEIVGLEHRNYVYNGQAVTITAKEALADEDESGFLVPMHYPTLREMGLVNSTQMTTANTFIVFNSYTLVKIRWYQRGFFKIILIIASVAISVLFPPLGGLGAASGILGTNLAVGAALGIASATVGAIVGAVVNGIAAMILSNLIMKYSADIFGDKLGAIIGTIVSFVAMTYGSAYGATGSFDVDWGNLMRAENFINLSSSVSKAYTGWLNADTASIYASATDVQEKYKDEMEEIEKLSEQILGMTNQSIDPMIFTDSNDFFGESSETFINRTLLTGSDIADLTHSLIENFSEVSLELPHQMM